MIAPMSHDDLPAFPEGLPLAPIARISHDKLLQNDPAEAEKVLEACRTHGFFYLDLTDTDDGQTLLGESEDLLELAYRAFDCPVEEKRKFALVKGVSLFGYKENGTIKLTDPEKRPDTTEFFNVSKDHMHGITESRTYPSTITDNRDLFKQFTRNAHETCMLVLTTLAKQLNLAPDAFANKNLFSEPSGDHCRLTHKFAHHSDKSAIGLPSHTDFGSITMLFNWLGGLQIQSHDPAKNREWEYVKPMPGHAIINLGDAMVTFTNGLLKSGKHRVIPAPGEQASVDRYSVVYFVRPHDSVMMEPLPEFTNLAAHLKVAGKFEPEGGKTLTAGEWMRQRSIQLGS
ncbi:putative 1-aminocyclopropane-1-carboxylate oxidase [Cladophialophora carrionii]|uniref:Putative 1-aminocyclopropane-1-carboxylate oxidase n=1 Tax=Cladophialophora carrionii TaxID=86049 RepID=A0A1C1CPN1_9EURO|nr:putative 1-aminocyclopropane-1-carboxylate oxidase [Cladophialophora carrionii]